jgi:hypothetical protein
MHDFPYFLGAFLTASLYAVILEKIGKENYEPDYTVVTVAIGVALTGGWVAARVWLAPLPALSGAALARWVWWLWFWMFVTTGTPITLWQIWQSRGRLAAYIAYLLRRRHVHPAADEAALAARFGSDPNQDD